MPKQNTPDYAPESGVVKIFVSNSGNLSSIDEFGVVKNYALGVNVNPVAFGSTAWIKLTAQQLADKKIQLPTTPLPNSVVFKIDGCLNQLEGQGFYIVENFIQWDNYGLDGFLDQTDLIQISYSFYS